MGGGEGWRAKLMGNGPGLRLPIIIARSSTDLSTALPISRDYRVYFSASVWDFLFHLANLLKSSRLCYTVVRSKTKTLK